MILDYSKEGLPIELDKLTKEVIYKEHRVSVNNIILAYQSGRDRVELTDTLSFFKMDGLIEFGCLCMTETKFKQLLSKVKKELQPLNK